MMMNMKKSISYRFRFKRMIGFHFLYNKKFFLFQDFLILLFTYLEKDHYGIYLFHLSML